MNIRNYSWPRQRPLYPDDDFEPICLHFQPQNLETLPEDVIGNYSRELIDAQHGVEVTVPYIRASVQESMGISFMSKSGRSSNLLVQAVIGEKPRW